MDEDFCTIGRKYVQAPLQSHVTSVFRPCDFCLSGGENYSIIMLLRPLNIISSYTIVIFPSLFSCFSDNNCIFSKNN